MSRSDLLIVGAGPAGAAAALEAASEGLEVTVVDKARFPRDKCCGDGITTAALRQLDELGVDITHLPSHRAIDGFVLTSPKGVAHHYPLAPNHGAVVRRAELDNALVDAARKAGAVVHEERPLERIEIMGERVQVWAGGHEHQAKWLIAADGMWSPTRRLLGAAANPALPSMDSAEPNEGAATPPRRYLGEWHAFRQYFEQVSPAAQQTLMIWFEPDLLPGYVWSFPEGDGAANVGFGIHRGHHYSTQDMGRLWPELLQRPHIAEFLGADAVPEAPHRAWPIPARLGGLPLSAHGGRVLFAGDAAAATDPLTGEGIGQALETGRMAARAIGNASSPSEAARDYARELRLGMQRDHTMANLTSKILASESLTEWGLRLASATNWTTKQFALWLFEAYPRATVFNPRRWYGTLGK